VISLISLCDYCLISLGSLLVSVWDHVGIMLGSFWEQHFVEDIFLAQQFVASPMVIARALQNSPETPKVY
jgi:hypothetical protein